MKIQIKYFKSKFVSFLTIITLVLVMIGPKTSTAASLSAVSDTMSRNEISALSSHTIRFTSTSAIGAGNTIAIAFPATFTTTGLVITDLQICHGASTGLENGAGASCTANNETIAASNGASTIWGAVISGTTTITFTAPSGTFTNTIAAGHKVTVIIASTHMQNPSSAATPSVTITTTSDSGVFTVPIIDDDTVSVTATVNETLTFDIDAATDGSNGESSAPYTVPLGTLSSGSVTVSNSGSVRMIVLEGDTNAGGGMAVTVNNVNGADGLESTSVPADKIPSATGTMAAGTANFGLCIATSGLVGWTRATGYVSDTCALSSGTNQIRGLSTTPTAFLNSGGAPLASTAHAEVVVNAAISAVTPAHTDYADAVTFIATGTF